MFKQVRIAPFGPRDFNTIYGITKFVGFHNILVLDRVSDVNIGWEFNLKNCGIKIDVVSTLSFHVQMRNQSLNLRLHA